MNYNIQYELSESIVFEGGRQGDLDQQGNGWHGGRQGDLDQQGNGWHTAK